MPNYAPYDPVGAMGGLFAPAYIHGNPQAEAAVAAWMANHFSVTPDVINASRGPSVNGNPGYVDPNALVAAAQGGAYDLNARRDAVAAQVQQQQQQAAAAAVPPGSVAAPALGGGDYFGGSNYYTYYPGS